MGMAHACRAPFGNMTEARECVAKKLTPKENRAHRQLYAPHLPQMRGTHVTGLVSCTRILKRSVSSPAPFMPSIWRTPLFFSAGAAALLPFSVFWAAARRMGRLPAAVSGGVWGGRGMAQMKS